MKANKYNHVFLRWKQYHKVTDNCFFMFDFWEDWHYEGGSLFDWMKEGKGNIDPITWKEQGFWIKKARGRRHYYKRDPWGKRGRNYRKSIEYRKARGMKYHTYDKRNVISEITRLLKSMV